MNQPSYNPHSGNHGTAAKKSGMSGLTIALIIIGVLLLFFIVIAVVGGYFVSQMFVDSKVMKTVVSNDNLTELQVPSNWNEIRSADKNSDASLQYCNLFAETYGLVITETRAEVAAAMEISEKECTLEEFAGLMIGSLKTDGFVAEPAEELTINGLTAKRFKMRANLDGIAIFYIVTFVDGQRHLHQVHCWTLQSREETNLPTLTKVANSFRELEPFEL